MANFPFVIGDALQIGTATITATGNAVVLPTGTQVGSTAVATSTEVATGGGPKITNLQVIDNSFQVLDDTAVDITGGYIKITGTNFTSGCIVYIGLVPATATSFVSATEVRAQLAATAAGTYPVYLVNPDGGVAIRVPGVTFSASPSWQTASALSDQYDGAPLTLALVASDATSYTLVSGALPPGLSLNTSTGAITGTITGVTVDTVYTFTVRATDAQNQDSPRTFTVNVAVSDTYFRLTTLLLSGSALSANTVIRDSSTNNFNLTVYGDSRASNFTPYGTGWSVYFDGTGDYLSLGNNNPLPATGDFTFECWIYVPSLPGVQSAIIANQNQSNRYMLWLTSTGGLTIQVGASFSRSTGNNVIAANRWYHIATTRTGTTHNLFVDGIAATLTTSGGSPASIDNTEFFIGINYNSSYAFTGYISNFRVVTSILYTSTFTPSTGSLTAITNTSLLTCHANRFLDGSTNNFAITRNGDAKIVSFNPFNITNTGVNGSMYFDGTGDYLTVPSNAVFAFGTGDFTIEFWLYPTTVATTQRNITFPTTNAPIVYINGSRQLVLENYGIAAIATTTNTVDLNAWNHCVATRQSGTLKLFINGVQGVSVANSTNWVQSAVNIGTDAGTNFTNGYITDVRILKGTGYSTITVPTSPLTAIANTQLLTLQYDQPHNNHTFLDSSSNQFLITRNGNATQGTFSPFSPTGWSVYLDGTGDVLTIPDSAISQLGSSDFTLECWINTSKTTGGSILTKGVDENVTWGNFFFTLNSSNYLFFEIDPTPSTSADRFSLTDTVAISSGQWHHVAVTRSGNNWKLFRNGTIAASGTSSASFSDDTYAWVVGGSRVSGSTTGTWMGYISNLRLIKGSAVYTTAFTPPTSPLTAITNTAFLICHTNRFIDASTNNFAITVTGDSKVVAFSPFAPTAVYNPAVHGGSAYFDGSGDYLSSSINAISTNDFIIQYWSYLTSHSGLSGEGGYFQISATSGGLEQGYTNGIMATRAPGGTLVVNITNTSISTNYALPLNQWFYTVITRLSNTVRVYVNNLSVATPTTVSTNLSGTFCAIGGYYSTSYLMTGYLANFRVLIGTGYNDGTLPALPTAPVTATTNTQLLLNFTDAAILDSTGRNVLETVADAKSSSVITKFTGGSMYFDGTGDWTIIPTSPNFGYGTGDFTIEFWMYWTGVGSQTILSNLTNSSSTNPHLWLNAGVLVYFTVGADRITGSSITANQWYHIALSRASGSTKLFVNGTQSGSTYADSNNYGTTAPFGLATYWNNGTPNAASVYSGYISDLRITKGYARYTANFTAPTAPARLK